jgi:hypothetical protein
MIVSTSFKPLREGAHIGLAVPHWPSVNTDKALLLTKPSPRIRSFAERAWNSAHILLYSIADTLTALLREVLVPTPTLLFYLVGILVLVG